MAEWIFRREQGCCAWLGRGPGKRSKRRSRHKAICPNGMRSFWKVAAFRLTESIRIQSGRRALRCFQKELHHFIILNLKWYKSPLFPHRFSNMSDQLANLHVQASGLTSDGIALSFPVFK